MTRINRPPPKGPQSSSPSQEVEVWAPEGYGTYSKLSRLDQGSLQRVFHHPGEGPANLVLKSPHGVPFGPAYRQTSVAVAEMTGRATRLLATTKSFTSDFGRIVQPTRRTLGGQVVAPFCEEGVSFDQLEGNALNYAWHMVPEIARRAQRLLSEDFPVELRWRDGWQLRSLETQLGAAADYVPVPSQWKQLYRRGEAHPETDVPPLEATCQVVDGLDREKLGKDGWLPAVWAEDGYGNFRFSKKTGEVVAWRDPVAVYAALRAVLERRSASPY